MYIKNIKLKNYRNYQDLTLSFDERVNIILGNNAQGKTNLIEAIYLSSNGKSFRTNKEGELIKFGNDFSFVDIKAYKDEDELKVSFVLNKDGKKTVKVDGLKLNKISQLLENILVVIFSPEDLKIVKDEPDKRRKFIDRELCQISPSYFDNLSNYKQTLFQRNSYLKEEKIDMFLLDIWDNKLAEYGVRVINSRRNFIDKISKISGKVHSNITENKENLRIEYNPSVDIVTKDEFFEVINKSRENDIRQRTTGKGPHKDDIIFYLNDINARSFGSQGQQRTCALSLKLAELSLIKEETGENGILLLDDVMSELDLNRQEFLIKTLSDNQIFITTTNIDDKILDSFPHSKIFKVENGNVK